LRTLPERTAWRPHPRAARRTNPDSGPRRSSATAGTARLIGAIIAGGASTRFDGEPKGLHAVGGRRIIDRVANALASVVTELVVVSNAPDAASWLPGTHVVRDTRPERGSLVGLHTALTHAGDSALVVAWDMPFVTGKLLRLIVDRGATSEYAVVPVGASGPESFCAFYRADCLPFLDAALDAEDLRLSALLARLPNVDYLRRDEVAGVGDPDRLFFNVNDHADLIAANRLQLPADG
jgi:molybdopterin-guanine dinucleotide biosynthesis protein A